MKILPQTGVARACKRRLQDFCRLRVFALLVLLLFSSHPAAADTLRLDARGLFAKSVTADVRLSGDGQALELERDELIEDDGPAAGYSYQPNEEKLSASTWIKKEFLISDPRADRVTLLSGPGGPLQGLINGQVVPLQGARKVGQYWQGYDLPRNVLKPGKNEVVLHGNGKLWIARAEEFASGSVARPRPPNRSAKSTDAGKSWQSDRLGFSGDVAGEYYVRLFLNRFRRQGVLTLPVLDVGNLTNQPIAPPVTAPGKIRINVLAERGAAGLLRVRARTGSAYALNAKHWSAWEELDPQGGTLERPAGRYLQLAVVLETTNPLQTPHLRQIVIETNPQWSRDWTKAARVVAAQNEEIIRTSVPFAYEPLDHPLLRQLRQDCRLDRVVAGAQSEFELITRLAAWSSRQWQRGHLRAAYPPWNALEILKLHADGTPVGGFCQQYNVVFLQACESFGLVGRAVSLGAGDHGAKIRSGHEVVEIWSNEHKKWVHVDGQLARYYTDVKSGQPLSLWELRERQLALFRGKPTALVQAVPLAKTEPWAGLSGFPPFFELRLIPRSNFLEKTAPLPPNQGMRGWFWTGHHVWTDADYPASLLYGHRITSRRNWNWTLNQTHCWLEATETPGLLRVQLDTETPSFSTFIANIDGQRQQPVTSGFPWRLHEGQNRLEVRSRNVAGRDGIVSRLVLDYPK